MPRKKRTPGPADLLQDVKFVKLTMLHDLAYAEQLQAVLRQQGVGAVIINDENVQGRPKEERADVSSLEGFRIEVPAPMIQKAMTILHDLQRNEE